MPEITNIEKFKEALEVAANTLIIFGNDYSVDELAAGLSLGLSLEKSGKKVSFFSSKETLVEHASLFGIDRITNKLNSGNLIVSIPNALESVDKVTHYLDGETLNIVVHPVSGAQLVREEVTINEMEVAPNLAIFVNTSWSKFLQELTSAEQEIYSEVPKVILKKTIGDEVQGLIVSAVEPASLSETAVWLLTKLNLPIDEDCASNLFQGIQFATKFTPPAATASTFEAASICVREKPVISQITQETPYLAEFFRPQEVIARSKSSPIADINKGFPKTDILQTPAKTVKSDTNQEFPNQDLEDGEVPSEWSGPKIFKSSSGKLRKT